MLFYTFFAHFFFADTYWDQRENYSYVSSVSVIEFFKVRAIIDMILTYALLHIFCALFLLTHIGTRRENYSYVPSVRFLQGINYIT